MASDAAPLVLRPARMSDWPRLCRIVRTIFAHLEDDEVSYLFRRHHTSTVVACRGRAIIGFYQFHPHADPGVAWLNHIGVLPQVRGHGEADALMVYFMRQAKTCGFDSVALDAYDDNARAHRFYERLGFARGSLQTHEDGVKWRFVRPLAAVDPLESAVTPLQPPGRTMRAWRKLAYWTLARFS